MNITSNQNNFEVEQSKNCNLENSKNKLIFLLRYFVGCKVQTAQINEEISLTAMSLSSLTKDMNQICLGFLKKAVDWFLVETNLERGYFNIEDINTMI